MKYRIKHLFWLLLFAALLSLAISITLQKRREAIQLYESAKTQQQEAIKAAEILRLDKN